MAGRRIKGFSLGMSQRLGIAAALLGDPGVVMFDEPVNGLDPEGILWIRNLLRGLAAEGRTVLVSSHLMSEMAQTADHLVVIGRGRLLADLSMTDFLEQSGRTHVQVRSPRGGELADLLRSAGGEVAPTTTCSPCTASPASRSATSPRPTASPCTSCSSIGPRWRPRSWT